jgi:anti-sigma regulatory factor (Ser/Thr protein kinase)
MAPAPIKLSVPGTLRYRPIAVRVVAEAARLVSGSPALKPISAEHAHDHDHGVHDDHFADSIDVRDPFDTAVVSAFMEIFNNVAIHAYKRRDTGTIELVITPGERELVIEIKDQGAPFDLEGVAALPDELDEDSLPEGGMGIHIAKTMLDEMTYEPGPPNVWRLSKRLPALAKTGSGRS